MRASNLFLPLFFVFLLLTLCSCGPFGLLPLVSATAAAGGGGDGDDKKPPQPEMATNPYPADWTGNTPVTVSLSWDWADRADYYDIYFGTDFMTVSNAGYGWSEHKGRISDSYYDPPGNLTFSTTYYWRVDPGNAGGVTRGDTWRFTTEDAPVTEPDMVQNPVPPNSSTGIVTDQVLSWGAANRATSYDIYFGTDPVAVANANNFSPEFRGNQPALTHNPGGLDYTTTYYWRIDSRNSIGPTEGDLWSFTTLTPPAPAANFTASTTSGNAPLWVSFTDMSTGSITSWWWSFGDGGTSSAQSPSYTYNNPGTYTVTLTVDGPGGWDEEIKTSFITVTGIGPVAGFTASTTSGNAPLWVSFTDMSTGSITSWYWSFGDGGSSGAQNPSYTYNNTGTYTVTLTVDGPGGWDEEIKTSLITVTGGGPVADFTANRTTGGAPLDVNFSDMSSGSITSWVWDFGDGGTGFVQDPGHTYTSQGIYTVTLTVYGPGGSDQEVKAGYITVADQVEDFETGDLSKFPWSTGGNGTWYVTSAESYMGTYSARSGTISHLENTYLEVTLTVQAGNITFYKKVSSEEFCDYLIFYIDGNQQGSWSGEIGWSQDSFSVSAGTRTFRWEYTKDGSVNSFQDTVWIDDIVFSSQAGIPPSADFTASPTVGNAPLDVSFTDASTGLVTAWSWDFGDTGTSTAPNPAHTYTTPGTYSVTLTVAGPDGSDWVSKLNFITVTSAPLTTFYVATTGNDITGDGTLFNPFITIQKGLDSASDGTTVIVLNGTHTGAGNRDLDFSGKLVYLKSATGAANCIIDCQYSGRGFDFYSGEGPSSIVEGFTIRNGSVTGSGGGILCSNSSPTIKNCIIIDNSATNEGGGIECYQSGPTIENCTILNNSAGTFGGGVYCEGNFGQTFINCVIANNTASSSGGGFACWGADPTMTNCTLANNAAGIYGGGVYFDSNCDATCNNSIAWSNTAATSGDEGWINDIGSTLTLNYCCVGSGDGVKEPTFIHCILADPLFRDQANGDYRLKPGSPCFDAGSDSYVTWTEDLDGNSRIMGRCVDMGAYEINVIHVPSDQATIQNGINAATDWDVVLVADGAYRGPGNKELNFGGKTIGVCSEYGPASCLIDCQNSGRGFYFNSGETQDSLVDGFMILYGDIDPGYGGAIYCGNSSPTIANCLIAYNTASLGGGICCEDASPIITNCTIALNIANSNGGGICCRFNSSPTITNCTINENLAINYGGAIHCDNNSSPAITNCAIVGNTSNSNGGGICCRSSSSPTITNCTIAVNTATVAGGGGGIDCETLGLTLTNCTITANSAVFGGGVRTGASAICTFNNTIIWGNGAAVSGNQFYVNTGDTVNLNYCDYGNNLGDVIGTVSPTACISLDPLFANVAMQDYHLMGTSPCIDVGDNSLIPAGITTDLDGDRRIRNAIVDIGAYEHRTWIQRFPASSPTARYSHSMAYDSARGVTVLFGGYDGSRLDDTWEWDGVTWTQKAVGAVPKPFAREGHAMAYDSARGVVVLFGGGGDSIFWDDETWEWDGVDWTQKFPGTKPPPRKCHAMAYDSARGVTVLFGGDSGGSWTQETWEYDGLTWTQQSSGAKPATRGGNIMVYDSALGVSTLFGGGGWTGVYYNDTWEWNGADWTEIFPLDKPSPRGWYAIAYDSARSVTVLFGGSYYDGSSYFYDDTWEWNGNDWRQNFPVDKPSAQFYPAMVYDSARGVFVLFGGQDSASVSYDETWEY